MTADILATVGWLVAAGLGLRAYLQHVHNRAALPYTLPPGWRLNVARHLTYGHYVITIYEARGLRSGQIVLQDSHPMAPILDSIIERQKP